MINYRQKSFFPIIVFSGCVNKAFGNVRTLFLSRKERDEYFLEFFLIVVINNSSNCYKFKITSLGAPGEATDKPYTNFHPIMYYRF